MGKSRTAAGTSGPRRNPPQAADAVGAALRPAPRRRRAVRSERIGRRARSRGCPRGRAGRRRVACGVVAGGGCGSSRSRRGEVVLRFGEMHRTMGPGFNWAPYFVDTVITVNVDRVRNAEDRLPQPGQQRRRGPARGPDADRGREHRRPPVRGAVPGEGSRAVPVREQRAGDRAPPGDGERGARDRRAVEDGLRAHRRPRRGGGRNPGD